MNHLIVDYLTISFKFTTEFKKFMLDGLKDEDRIKKGMIFSDYFKDWI